MDYRNVRETAESWGISDRLVQRLCSGGRIEGARKLGGTWIIPENAEKPEDLRKRRSTGREPAERPTVEVSQPDEKHRPSASWAPSAVHAPQMSAFAPGVFSRLMPLMNTSFEPGTCQQTIEQFEDPEIRMIAQAEFCYFSGDAERAVRLTSELLSHDDLAVRLSACLIYAYANLSLGNINRSRFALAELQRALKASPNVSSEQSRAAIAFMGHTSSILLHIPVPDDVPPVDSLLPLLPPGLRAFALYVRAHALYLSGDYARSLGVAEAALLMSPKAYPISDIYLNLVAVMDCMSLKRTADAREHLLTAWELARPDGLIEAFGEHHGLLGGMLESVIKSDWPEDFKRVIDITYRFSAGWRRVHNPATAETVADNLTTTEFAVSMLAARGWTNSEIGQHLDISANTVKSYLTSAFRKLGISKRQDLAQYMLR